jgi:hypothetical protein
MRRCLLALAIAGVSVVLLVPTGNAARILPESAKPMQMSYTQWVVTYYRAAVKRSFAAPTALLTINEGKCGFAYGKVWFLPDVWRETTLETTCVIPRGKLLFVPGPNILGPGSRANLAVRQNVRQFIAGSEITVDGRSLGAGRWVSTPVFGAVLPQRNSLRIPPGLWTFIQDGYFAILAPLPPGTHTVTTTQIYREPRAILGYVYHLTIK